MENKGEIVRRLYATLKETREFEELKDLEYIKETGKTCYEEYVTATFENGYTKEINVAHDSGIAMIRDIIKGLG
ncbi:MAG: hypothetical protein J6D57_10270 [Mogibacterium sp.]|nr:hypothetical protein [Mogibacterium sp.]